MGWIRINVQPRSSAFDDSITSAAFPLMRGPIINVEESTDTDGHRLQQVHVSWVCIICRFRGWLLTRTVKIQSPLHSERFMDIYNPGR
jgi:hypothetical protein